MAYQEVNPTTWTYSNDGDFIEGILVQIQSGIGANESMLYSIDTTNGIKSVWGATILDERMAFVKVGDKVKITFKGLGEKKQGKNPPKLFKVEIDKQ